jgi:hypothetical protein
VELSCRCTILRQAAGAFSKDMQPGGMEKEHGYGALTIFHVYPAWTCSIGKQIGDE